MPIQLVAANLLSRVVRTQIGERGIATDPIERQEQGGILSTLFNVAKKFTGFLVKGVLALLPALSWTLSSLWEIFTTGLLQLYYFDWNIPDSTIDQQAQAQWASYGGILGGLTGSAFGWFTCGIIPAASIAVFNEALALHVLKEVGEEALDELTGQFAYVLRLTVRNAFQQTVGWLYKGARRALKDPSNPILGAIFGDRADAIRKTWGEANAPSWSFAQAVEDRIEKIPNQFWQNFAEEFIEEAIDSCIEAGYVVANSIEGFYTQQKAAENQQLKPRVVEVEPNRDNDREKIVIAGYEPEVRAALPIVLAQHQMVESRDIGQIVGEPLDDYVRPKPFNGLRLKFKMFSLKSPPYARRGNDRLVEVTISVPNVARSKIDWDRLRLACGGRNGYLWGRFRAHAVLDDGHPLSCYGGTPDEAEDRLKAMAELTESEIKTISVTEEKKEGERLKNPKMYKETTRVYPAYVSIINRERTLANDLGRRSLDGNYIDKEARIDLWRATEPPDFEEVVRELLRRST